MHSNGRETLHYNTQEEYKKLITTKLNVMAVQLIVKFLQINRSAYPYNKSALKIK
jgi:hypothetical protein